MSGSQKFIARIRAPRVQIEYDVELYGAQKKVQLPFVMGVMSDLAGKSEQPPVADRKFLEIDVDNFDERMRAIAPRASFSVPNTLNGEGNLAVDLSFEKMEDFSPQAIAARVDALAPLLEARRQLADLTAYMDGKSRAEALIENLLSAPELLQALAGGAGDAGSTIDMDAALASLKARMPDPAPEDDSIDRTLAGLAARAPQETPPGPSVDDVLGVIDRREEVAETDRTSDVLAGIERREEIAARDEAADVLAGIERREAAEQDDGTDDVLAGIERRDEIEKADATADVLAGIERREEVAEVDGTSDVLAGIERREETGDTDDSTHVLAGIERREEVEEADDTADILARIERREEVEDTDDTTDVLAGIEHREASAEEDTTSEVLAGIERRTGEAPQDDTADVLAGIERREAVAEDDRTGDVLEGIERREEAWKTDGTAEILSGIERREETVEEDRSDDVLAGIERREEEAEPDVAADVLAGMERKEDVVEQDDASDILAGIERRGDAREEDSTADILAGPDAPEPEPAEDLIDNAPASLAPAEAAAPDDPALDDLLADLDAGDDPGEGEPEPDDLPGDLGLDDDAEIDAKEHAGAEAASGRDELDELDDLLAGLGTDDAATADEADSQDGLEARVGKPEEVAGTDDLDALLADLGGTDHATEAGADGLDDGTGAEGETLPAEDPAADDDLDALLADLGGADDTAEAGTGDFDDAGDVAGSPPVGDAPESEAAEDDLDALLADLGATELADDAPDAAEDLDALPGGDDEVDADSMADEDKDTGGDLDDLVADLGAAEVGEDAASDDLDALLSELTSDDAAAESSDSGAQDDLDALLADMGTVDLGEETAEAPHDNVPVDMAGVVPEQAPFGTVSAPRPERESMNRNRFRMAIFGDFTGRSSRGLMETGDALAARKPFLLDVDTVEEVIEGFATTLTLPIGKDGEGIEVKLGGLDDLHPDELYENVEIFDAISGLRQQLGVGSMAGRATEQLKEWAQEFGTPVRLPKRSAATSVPPDLKLSDFQALIGDTRGTLTRATPADDLIARIVGPHVVKAPDAGAADMLKSVDEALSAAMRLVLHHPDFQAVESQWRSLDLLARRIETDTSLEVVLYDVSAEELAADLSAQEDLAQSGLYRLLTGVMDPEDGDGGFSALFGLYTFEETPPHAELLARIGLVAAHVDAPFIAAISPAYLETPKEERHKLVAEAWDALRAQPQAAWLGLASPRFMLRQPYGAKSDPCYEFEFEEFTPKEGLKGLLWANPVVLVAILLAATYKKDGKLMNLGSLMSLGDIPFTYVDDRYGDQVALPCTERNLTSDAAQATLARGYMPVLWVKGRNEIRLGSFRSLGDAEIAGPWSDAAPARPSPPQATLEMDIRAEGASGGAASAGGATDDPLADPGSLLDSGDSAESGDGLDLLDSGDDDGQSLDDLLASFADDDDDAAGDDDDMDPELAALLEGL